MKYFLIIALALTSCAVTKPRPAQPIRLTVTHVLKNGYESGISEVWAKYRRHYWMAQCENLPDSVKVGTVITAEPTKQPDTCNCVFKRIK